MLNSVLRAPISSVLRVQTLAVNQIFLPSPAPVVLTCLFGEEVFFHFEHMALSWANWLLCKHFQKGQALHWRRPKNATSFPLQKFNLNKLFAFLYRFNLEHICITYVTSSNIYLMLIKTVGTKWNSIFKVHMGKCTDWYEFASRAVWFQFCNSSLC